MSFEIRAARDPGVPPFLEGKRARLGPYVRRDFGVGLRCGLGSRTHDPKIEIPPELKNFVIVVVVIVIVVVVVVRVRVGARVENK